MQTILHTKKREKAKPKSIGTLIGYSQQMAANPTSSEAVAYALLSRDFAVETQIVFGFYILDFVLPAKMLCIEIDGSSHDNRSVYDQRRDQFVKRFGVKVLRVPANEAHNLPALLAGFPDVDNYKSKWLTAQEKATRYRSTSVAESESASSAGRKKGWVKPLYTPKREQAHVLKSKQRKAHLANCNYSNPASIAENKALREARQQATWAALGIAPPIKNAK